MSASLRLLRKNFDQPEETRTYDNLHVDIVHLDDFVVSRNTYSPGWTWEANMEPRAQTAGCQTEHLFYVVSGRLRVKAPEGEEMEYGPGDVGRVLPGHEGRVVGSDPAEIIDFGGHMCAYGGIWPGSRVPGAGAARS